MLNLATNPVSLTAWTSPEFSEPCSPNESFYLRAASWSPDESTVYIGTTGYKPPGNALPGKRAPTAC